MPDQLKRPLPASQKQLPMSTPSPQATSFADSPWPQAGSLLTALPEVVYNTLPIGLSPIISNPFSIAMK